LYFFGGKTEGMKRVKVGVIGCGHIAQEVHIPNYMENSKSILEAVCDVNQDISNEVAMEYKLKHVFNDYRELLDSDLVEAVSVCVPTSLHSKVVIDAVTRGIHVLCEKPLATDMKEADEMLEAVSRSGVKFMVGFNRRFLPNHMKAKEYLEKGKIGRPILARAQTITAGPYENEIEKSSYPKEAEKRLGCLFDSGSHLADLIMWMLGKPSEVSASVSTWVDGVRVDDSAVVLVKFENGALGSICTAWLNLPDYQAMEETAR
jgi:UDP-N-acetylglucosamine 3-dehydrogenase